MFPKPKKTQEKLPKKRNFVTKFSKNCLKWLKFTYFVDNTSKCIPYQNFFNFCWLIVKNHKFTLFICRIFLSVGWKFCKKCWISWVFWFFRTCFRTFQAKKKFEIFLPTDWLKYSANKQGEFVIFDYQSAIVEVF